MKSKKIIMAKKIGEIIYMENKIILLIEKNNSLGLSKRDIIDIVSNQECDLKIDLGIDSFSMVSLLIEIEEEFNFEFEYDSIDFEELKTFKGLCKYIEKYI